MRIAIFDSGLGGLTVLAEAVRLLPGEDFIYYADTKNVPYGTKPKSQVKASILEAVQSIVRERVKAVVIACNTATSVAIHDLRAMHPIPVIGMEPAVKPAIELGRQSGQRVLVLATPLTLQETKFKELVSRLDSSGQVDALPLPELVEYCERQVQDEGLLTRYFQAQFAPYQLDQYCAIVLGCTHFPFYRGLLKRIVPAHVRIMDGNAGTVLRLDEVLRERGIRSAEGQGHVAFRCSGGEEDYLMTMQQAFERIRNEGQER